MPYIFDTELNPGAGSGGGADDVYVRTLFGELIRDNPVPVRTAEKEACPFVAFQDPKTGKKIGLSKEQLSYGVLTLADPGGGKTNLLNMILSQLLATQSEDDVIVIFDTKGDYLYEFGDRIPDGARIVVGAGEEYRNVTAYHNLFAEIMPRDIDGSLVYVGDSDSDGFEIAKQLFAKMNSETQPIFPAMAEQIFAGVLSYFMRTYWCSDQSMLNNRELIRFLFRSTNEELKAVFQLDYMEDYRSCADYISNKSNQTQGVNSYLGSMVRELFVGPFAKSDPGREFSMREAICGPGKKVIFIEYDLKKGDTLAPMDGILIDRALANGLGGRQRKRKQVYILLDEVLLLPKLANFANGLNFGRSQGVRLLCGLQNLPGAADLYGESGAKRTLAAFQNIFAFRVSDYDTRRFLMDRLGSNYQNISFRSQQSNVHIQREGHTVEEWELLSLRFGEAVVSLKNEKPFLFTMPKYQ